MLLVRSMKGFRSQINDHQILYAGQQTKFNGAS